MLPFQRVVEPFCEARLVATVGHISMTDRWRVHLYLATKTPPEHMQELYPGPSGEDVDD